MENIIIPIIIAVVVGVGLSILVTYLSRRGEKEILKLRLEILRKDREIAKRLMENPDIKKYVTSLSVSMDLEKVVRKDDMFRLMLDEVE